MEERVEFICCSKHDGSKDFLNKNDAKERIIELFKKRKIKKIEIEYENESV